MLPCLKKGSCSIDEYYMMFILNCMQQLNKLILHFFPFFRGLVVCNGDGTRPCLKLDQFSIILKND
jgi:hypothetical protein